MIASAVKNIFNATGTRFPNKEAMPNVNAISVAVGMAQPLMASVPLLNNAYNNAGASIPPMAPNTGNNDFLIEASSPHISSRLISMPARKKNSAINASLIISRGELGSDNMPMCT